MSNGNEVGPNGMYPILGSRIGVSIRLNGSVSIFLFGFLFNRLYDEGNRTEPIFFRFFDLKTEI